MATVNVSAQRSTGSGTHRKPRRLALLTIAALAANWIPTTAGQADEGILTWIVQSISSADEGDLIQASAMQMPVPGSALVTGQRISTGANDTLVLVNGRDLVTIGPRSIVTVGDNDSTTPVGNLGLTSGTVHVEVGKRKQGQTFSVDAPYLVATVKGTKFDVTTSSETSAVAVTEGVVGVSAIATGLSVDVTAGQTATVARNAAGAPILSATLSKPAIKTNGVTPSTDSTSAGTGTDTGAAGAVSSAVGGATGAVGDAVGGATGAVGDAVGGAAGAVGDAVGGAVGGAVGDTGRAVGDAVGDVGGAVGGVGGAVGGAVGGLGGALGGGLGGLGGGR